MISLIIAAGVAAVPVKLPRPLTAAEKAGITKVVAEALNDPASAQYQWYKLFSNEHYCGRVNAKNRYGGYIGFQPFLVIPSTANGLVKPIPMAMIADGDPDSPMSMTVAKECLKEHYPIATAP